MELSHLLHLVDELPQNTILNYVRGTDTCKFIDVDIHGERINSETPTNEPKSWAPSYLSELATKIKENIPFNLSGLLNNKGSFRPVLETIIAHTREFYTVRKGTATALVWIPTKPKDELELKEIAQDDIPPQNISERIEVSMAIMNPIDEFISQDILVNELKKMYASLGSAGMHLFGLKFGKHLVNKSVKELTDLAVQAGISENYGAEINKLRNVYKAIHEHRFGVSFYEEIRLTPPDLTASGSFSEQDNHFLRAMRTKPFLLLAGISGTGKSRIVKQMAFDSCPNNALLRADLTSPGNYCLIEVKPNWHDSTELLGYESKIGHPHYQLTPFVKFLVKAMLFPEVPFFMCLDEMNLAPVEQYFAEFLSILESRTKIDGHIVSEPLIKASVFEDYERQLSKSLFDKEYFELKAETTTDENTRVTNVDRALVPEARRVYEDLKKYGLRIPENVIVVGTVNMDETTHQFSRKVIDRAMTIEMNLPEGKDKDGNNINPFMDFFSNSSDLKYHENPASSNLYLAKETKASDVVTALASFNEESRNKTEWLKGEVAKVLTNLNSALEGTPFKIAYRVQNELMLYFYQLWLENKEAKWRDILASSLDQILMMKVLPRIEGDNELLKTPLDELSKFCQAPYVLPNSAKKVKEMSDRLEKSQFTSFWP